ncbi:hypothetical protein [Candidatus Parabeggiatoa sp. HSG14]|uniref:hypothetical protein n=1 Tax=Candidatus Parabeggiatoa sp. HSG14 TaxID=3055593 RepID=UPI0025A86B03|nr:hypothetical protein [Thiotrichales bacterium HSG14]
MSNKQLIGNTLYCAVNLGIYPANWGAEEISEKMDGKYLKPGEFHYSEPHYCYI